MQMERDLSASRHSHRSHSSRPSLNRNAGTTDGAMIRRPKKLIVCCDGTWMDSDNGWEKSGFFDSGHLQTPSNITRLARAIKPDDSFSHPQVVYYQSGIGTSVGLWNHIVGGSTGLGFSENIREAYAFLANNYAQNDLIFLTGFSRGAYTARSLGGLIGQLGLLKKEGMAWFYDIFNDWQHAGDPDYTPRFLKDYSDYLIKIHGGKQLSLKTPCNDRDKVSAYLDEYRRLLLSLGLTQEAPIKAIGVFDTVGALGIPVTPIFQKMFRLPSFIHRYKWVDTSLDNHIENAFQALALDELRAPYWPSVWEKPLGCTTNLKQVWFAGAHSNVGGSYRDQSTANITLAWMMDQLNGDALKHSDPAHWHLEDWIEFDTDYLEEQYKLNAQFHEDHHEHKPWSMGTIYNSLSFPQSLAGMRHRSPGRTRPMVYAGDYVDKTRLLTDTNEYIHASIRTRIDMGGRSFEHDLDSPKAHSAGFKMWSSFTKWFHHLLGNEGKRFYLPHEDGALKDWVLKDGHGYHDEVAINPIDPDLEHEHVPPYWEYQGNDKLVPKNTRLPEDRLGTHELILLKKYQAIAQKVHATNMGLTTTEILKEWEQTVGEPRKASTY